MLTKLGREEKMYSQYIKDHCLDQLADIERDSEILAKAFDDQKDLKTVTEEMHVAKRKLRNAKKNRESYRVSNFYKNLLGWIASLTGIFCAIFS